MSEDYKLHPTRRFPRRPRSGSGRTDRSELTEQLALGVIINAWVLIWDREDAVGVTDLTYNVLLQATIIWAFGPGRHTADASGFQRASVSRLRIVSRPRVFFP